MGSEIKRQFDAVIINRVLNHPDVFPWVSAPGIDRLDFTEVAAREDAYILARDEGGFIFWPVGGGAYEVHTQFLPRSRGVVKSAHEAAAYMFKNTGCTEIRTFVPRGNDRAKRLTEAMGFDYEGVDGDWTYYNGETVPADYYVLTKDKWKCQQQQS